MEASIQAITLPVGLVRKGSGRGVGHRGHGTRGRGRWGIHAYDLELATRR